MNSVAMTLQILFSQHWTDCYRSRAKLAGVRQNIHGTLKRRQDCSRTKTEAGVFMSEDKDAGSCFVAAEENGGGEPLNTAS